MPLWNSEDTDPLKRHGRVPHNVFRRVRRIRLVAGLSVVTGFAVFLPSSFSQSLPDAGSSSVRQSPFGLAVSTGASFGDGLSFSDFRVSGRGMIPVNPPKDVLLLQPSFGLTSIKADSVSALPRELYQFGISAMWMHRTSDRLTTMATIRPVFSSDADSVGGHLQLFASAAANWITIPDRLRLMLGVAYTGRNDLPVLPMAGFQWTPNL